MARRFRMLVLGLLGPHRRGSPRRSPRRCRPGRWSPPCLCRWVHRPPPRCASTTPGAHRSRPKPLDGTGAAISSRPGGRFRVGCALGGGSATQGIGLFLDDSRDRFTPPGVPGGVTIARPLVFAPTGAPTAVPVARFAGAGPPSRVPVAAPRRQGGGVQHQRVPAGRAGDRQRPQPEQLLRAAGGANWRRGRVQRGRPAPDRPRGDHRPDRRGRLDGGRPGRGADRAAGRAGQHRAQLHQLLRGGAGGRAGAGGRRRRGAAGGGRVHLLGLEPGAAGGRPDRPVGRHRRPPGVPGRDRRLLGAGGASGWTGGTEVSRAAGRRCG